MPRLPVLALRFVAFLVALVGFVGVPVVLLGVAFGASGCDSGGELEECVDGEVETVDLAAGRPTGDQATAVSTVRISYTVRLENNEIIGDVDSQQVTLTQTSPLGFAIGVEGMREGGRRRITIPPNYGFGAAGVTDLIPPCETLTFEVTLIEVLSLSCGGGAIATTELEVGTGAEARPTSRVTVAYTGTLENGSVFDTSPRATFNLEDTVPGFRQGVTGMRVGGRRRIVIPPDLGYGAEGVRDSQGQVVIPGCETLTFEVELIALS